MEILLAIVKLEQHCFSVPWPNLDAAEQAPISRILSARPSEGNDWLTVRRNPLINSIDSMPSSSALTLTLYTRVKRQEVTAQLALASIYFSLWTTAHAVHARTQSITIIGQQTTSNPQL